MNEAFLKNCVFFVFISTVGSFYEEIEDRHDGSQYCNKVFGAWDYALSEENPAKFKKQSLYKDIVVRDSVFQANLSLLIIFCSKNGIGEIFFFVSEDDRSSIENIHIPISMSL